jgi:hypothetical protein
MVAVTADKVSIKCLYFADKLTLTACPFYLEIIVQASIVARLRTFADLFAALVERRGIDEACNSSEAFHQYGLSSSQE